MRALWEARQADGGGRGAEPRSQPPTTGGRKEWVCGPPCLDWELAAAGRAIQAHESGRWDGG